MSAQKKHANALQAVLDRQVAATTPEPAKPTVPAIQTRAKRQPNNVAAPTPEVQGLASPHYRPSRSGKRLIGGHFPPETAKHLKILAAEEGTSVQALLEEALDLLFVKKGKGSIKRT